MSMIQTVRGMRSERAPGKLSCGEHAAARAPRQLAGCLLGLAALGLAAPHARSGELHKCVAAGGSVSYQSAPCPPGSAVAWKRAYVPDPPTPHASVRQSASRTSPPRTSAPRRSASPRRSPARQRTDPCEAAKAYRERTLARVGLKRTFDLLRALDDRVYEACKPKPW